MHPVGTHPPSSDELELRQLFALPVEKRASVSERFAGLVWRLLTPHDPYVQRLASRWVRPHETEDVAADVVLKAAEDLKEQFLPSSSRRNPDGSQKRDWTDTPAFVIWFRNFCGYPFKRTRSGAITNVIRKVWLTSRHTSYDPAKDMNRVDDNLLDPQQQVIGAEDVRAEALRLQRLQPELERMDQGEARASFMLRLSSGVHNFRQLDADALVRLAKDLRLPRVQVALVKEIARGFEFEPGQKSLTNGQIGLLTGVGESGVRYQLTKAMTELQTALKRPQ